MHKYPKINTENIIAKHTKRSNVEDTRSIVNSLQNYQPQVVATYTHILTLK